MIENPWSLMGTFLINLDVLVWSRGGGGDFLAKNIDYWQTPIIYKFAQLNWLLHN